MKWVIREANGASDQPANGSVVAFNSEATNLVKDDTNGVGDVFVVEMATAVMRRVSVGPGWRQSNLIGAGPGGISADGHVVSFLSRDPGLSVGDTNEAYDLFVRILKP